MVMVADVDVETTTTIQTRQLPMLLDSTHWRNGTNYLLKSVTRFIRNVTRKANLVEPSILLVTSPLNLAVTAIIGAMQQVQSASPSEETELTSNTTQAGNSFGGKANVKKSCTIK